MGERSSGNTESAELAAQRTQMQRRRRRLILNNDGDDVGWPGSDTVAGLLSHRSEPLLGTPVDTVFYGTGVTTMFTHDAQVGETYDGFALDGSPRDAYRRNIRALRRAGTDALAATVAFCHEHDLEVFWSHRMNDVHDSAPDGAWLLCRWKQDNAHILMGRRQEQGRAGDMRSPYWWWSLLDFAQPDVRDYLCRIEADVCGRYDIDGVECDYFRTPLFFRPNLKGEPATDDQIEILTDFQRRLRQIHLEAGAARGRPILTAARVPATEALCRHVGIDVRTWLEQGLVDLLGVSGGYLPFTEPVADMIALAHEHDVPAYPSINSPLVTRRPSGQVEAMRGVAANLFAAGADGLLLFNCFDQNYEPAYVMDIGAKETLADRDKIFHLDRKGWEKGAYVQAIEQAHGTPIVIPGDGGAAIARLPIADDIADAARRGALAGTELQLTLSDPTVAEGVSVGLNGESLTIQASDAESDVLVCLPEASEYRVGMNEIHLSVPRPSADADNLTELTGLDVIVRYK